MQRRVLILLVAFFASFFGARAQQIEYGVRFDSTHMLIGDQQNLTFLVKSDIPLSLKFPQLEGEIGGLEILSGPHADSVKDGKEYIYSQVYRVTTFDTGVYVIPPQSILIAHEGYDNALTTDSIMIAVNTLVVDKEKGIADIEGPYEMPITFREALPYILYGLAAILVIALIGYIVIRLTTGKPIIPVWNEVVIPPYDLAMAAMQRLEASGLWQAGNEKQFYSEMTDILREYLDGELNMACMESTTSQIVKYLGYCDKIDDHGRKFIEEMLQTADLVKFAKMMPLQDENRDYMRGTIAVIDKIHSNCIVAVETDKANAEIQENLDDKNSKEVDNG